MGCGSSKATQTVVNVATATRAESTKKIHTVEKETPAQNKASTNDEEYGNGAHQGRDEKTEEQQPMEEPLLQPALQELDAANAEDPDDNAVPSETTTTDQDTEEPLQIDTPAQQDTANVEEHSVKAKVDKLKSTEESVQIKVCGHQINAVHQHDWMAPVSEAEREGWLTTCSMCGTKDDVVVVPPMTMTSDGLMTYDVESAEGEVTPVVCKPKPYSDEDTYARLDAHAVNTDRSLNRDFTALMTHLLEPARTDLEKARVLFRWATAQDLVNMQFLGETFH
ncbi:Hypp3767 [Branchiostoma lanceolatum]|uniref:Hypp3767 protein n=1 Tax=Branchiostoma lanceolatum TaxID=7740 RepID=A0A8K0A704_BRALA|nr:Hypp3767 [Branchiostoma lanceolatum]